jgi:hypothetical protein
MMVQEVKVWKGKRDSKLWYHHLWDLESNAWLGDLLEMVMLGVNFCKAADVRRNRFELSCCVLSDLGVSRRPIMNKLCARDLKAVNPTGS